MKALTAAEMREVDRLTTERYGISGLQLMEEAGKHVAEAVYGQTFGNKKHKIVILCGKGNNGGDGLVVARHLKEKKYEPKGFLFGKKEEMRGDAAANLDLWLKASGEIVEVTAADSLDAVWAEISRADVIIDAMLGTGLNGPAKGLIADTIEKVNEVSKNATAIRPWLVLAVDMPSGLPSDGQAAEGPVLYAHRTITFTAPKIGQLVSRDAACCGQLIVRQIGSPQELVEEIGKGVERCAGPEEFVSMPLVRPADSNKGTFGHALLLAGSLGKSGAAVRAGLAALRSGAGLVTIATPETAQPTVAAFVPEFMTEPLKATKSGTLSLRSLVDGTFGELEEGKTVLAVGPGLGQHRQTQEFIRTVVEQTELPVVLDADGLNAFAKDGASLRKRKTKFLAVTPHPGEMARLMGISTKEVQADRLKAARESAVQWNAHVILKGFHTIIASPLGEVFINTTGNPSLAKGGTGDVLTGVLAAMTAQYKTQDWHRVLALGVYLHGAAADRMDPGRDLSGVLAHEIANEISGAHTSLIRGLQVG